MNSFSYIHRSGRPSAYARVAMLLAVLCCGGQRLQASEDAPVIPHLLVPNGVDRPHGFVVFGEVAAPFYYQKSNGGTGYATAVKLTKMDLDTGRLTNLINAKNFPAPSWRISPEIDPSGRYVAFEILPPPGDLSDPKALDANLRRSNWWVLDRKTYKTQQIVSAGGFHDVIAEWRPGSSVLAVDADPGNGRRLYLWKPGWKALHFLRRLGSDDDWRWFSGQIAVFPDSSKPPYVCSLRGTVTQRRAFRGVPKDAYISESNPRRYLTFKDNWLWVTNGNQTLRIKYPYVEHSCLWSPDGNFVAVAWQVPVDPRSPPFLPDEGIDIVNVRSGRVTTVVESDATAEPRPVDWLRAGRWLIISDRVDTGNRISAFDTHVGTLTPIVELPGESNSTRISLHFSR